MANPYESIDFTPPQNVAEAAEKGLRLRKEFDRGGTEVGVARAEQLITRKPITPDDVKSMYSFFARHEVDSKSEKWADDNDPSPGYVAHLLWGGNPGKRWVGRLHEQMEKVDEKAE